MISQNELLELGPQFLKNRRNSRYEISTISLFLKEFPGEDQRKIRIMYDVLSELYLKLRDEALTIEQRVEFLVKMAAGNRWTGLILDVKELGGDVQAVGNSEYPQIVHDLRGGAFSVLVNKVEFFQLGIYEKKNVMQTALLARDHLKIMRSMIRGLDDEIRAKDETYKLHDMSVITENWKSASAHSFNGRNITIELDCQYNGWISERCIEISTLERVMYNMLNNALRHTADDSVHFSIIPLEPGEEAKNVRFVISNRVSDEDARKLEAQGVNSFKNIFSGKFTTTGSGLGMKICADIVGNAYGVASINQLIEEGYIGCKLIKDVFYTWFHWPIAFEIEVNI